MLGLVAILIGIIFENKVDILPYTQKGTNVVIFGFVVVAVATSHLYVNTIENFGALARLGITLIILIVFQLLAAYNILCSVDDSMKEYKQKVAQTFINSVRLKDISAMDDIQRSVSISSFYIF